MEVQEFKNLQEQMRWLETDTMHWISLYRFVYNLNVFYESIKSDIIDVLIKRGNLLIGMYNNPKFNNVFTKTNYVFPHTREKDVYIYEREYYDIVLGEVNSKYTLIADLIGRLVKFLPIIKGENCKYSMMWNKIPSYLDFLEKNAHVSYNFNNQV